MTKNNEPSKQGLKAHILYSVRDGMNVLGRMLPGLVGWMAFYLLTRPKRRVSNLTERIDGLQVSSLEGPQGEIRTYSWAGSRQALLVHGWDSNAAAFASLIPKLQSAGWGGTTYDSPAHGRSAGSNTDFLKLGAAFRRVYLEHGPFDVVIAHSFGAAVSIYQLSRIEQADPHKLVIGGSPHSLSQVFNIFAEKLDLSDIVRQDLDRRIIDRLGNPVGAFDLTRAIHKLSMPILIIHDREDPLVPFASAEELHRSAQRSHFLVTSNLKHRRWLRDERVLDQVLGFLIQNTQENRDEESMYRAA